MTQPKATFEGGAPQRDSEAGMRRSGLQACGHRQQHSSTNSKLGPRFLTVSEQTNFKGAEDKMDSPKTFLDNGSSE